MFVLSIVLRIILRVNHRKAESSQTVKDMTWGSCLLSSYMTLVGQGWATTPDSLAGRIATIFSWVLGLVIYTSYTTNLISYLTLNTIDRPIRSLEEFSKRSDWTLALLPEHDVLNNWEWSNDRHIRALFERYESGEGFLAIRPTPENLRKLAQPKVMIYTSRDELPHFLSNHACHMVTLEENPRYEVSEAFLAMARNMPKIRAAISGYLRKLHDMGALKNLKKRWLSHSGGNDACEEVERHALSFAEVMPVLAVIVPGLVLSVLLLVLELAWAKLTKAWERL